MPAQQLLDVPQLRSRLKLKSITSGLALRSRHSHAAKLLATGTLAGTLLLAPASLPLNPVSFQPSALVTPIDLHSSLKDQLQQILPTSVTQLNEEQEQLIATTLKKTYGLEAAAVYQGERLNRNYGYIGQEQHLRRYPGDSIDQHSEPLKEGMAPGLGAWGYFAHSKAELTPQLQEIEKYYVAVQTLYLPDWYTRSTQAREWWKYRKMVAINPANGKLMVVAVGDSGPAWWTGKQFGGSPEVMDYLQMHDGRQKGPVIMFFLDDRSNAIPLGPLEYNLTTGQPLLS